MNTQIDMLTISYWLLEKYARVPTIGHLVTSLIQIKKLKIKNWKEKNKQSVQDYKRERKRI